MININRIVLLKDFNRLIYLNFRLYTVMIVCSFKFQDIVHPSYITMCPFLDLVVLQYVSDVTLFKFPENTYQKIRQKNHRESR